MFIIAITCITTIIIEYSNYSRNISNIAQTEAQKAKEKLLIQTNYENQTITINIKNEGSTPSTIVSILTLNPTTNTLTHYNLNQPLTCTILGETTIHLNQTIPQNHQIATLTSLGNTFWNTQTQTSPTPTITPSANPTTTPTLEPTPTPSPTSTSTPTVWLNGWQYRKSHIINPSTGAGTDYQIRFTVYYGSGVDSGSSVYLNGNCRSDFADIRFTSSDCLTLLSYWTETVSESNYATFWVKITDDLSINPATIYLYYDNPTATSTSNGAATFLIYQDIVADIRTQLGITDLTNYPDGFDPGDRFISNTPIDGIYASTCLWFQKNGGKQYQITPTNLYLSGYNDNGKYGTCGIDIRYRTTPTLLDWQLSQRNPSDTTLNRKHLLILDYVAEGNANLNFYSDWQNNPTDIPTGTIATTYTINTTPKTTQLYTHTGPISHITIGHQTNNHNLTIYHAHYAIAKYATNEPTHSTWSPQTQKLS